MTAKRLDDLETEAAKIRHDLAEYLSLANQAALSLTMFGKQLGRLEERIDAARAEAIEAAAGWYADRHEGNTHPEPTSDGPPVPFQRG